MTQFLILLSYDMAAQNQQNYSFPFVADLLEQNLHSGAPAIQTWSRNMIPISIPSSLQKASRVSTDLRVDWSANWASRSWQQNKIKIRKC